MDPNEYQKTYQDNLDVNNLSLESEKPLYLDKFFGNSEASNQVLLQNTGKTNMFQENRQFSQNSSEYYEKNI